MHIFNRHLTLNLLKKQLPIPLIRHHHCQINSNNRFFHFINSSSILPSFLGQRCLRHSGLCTLSPTLCSSISISFKQCPLNQTEFIHCSPSSLILPKLKARRFFLVFAVTKKALIKHFWTILFVYIYWCPLEQITTRVGVLCLVIDMSILFKSIWHDYPSEGLQQFVHLPGECEERVVLRPLVSLGMDESGKRGGEKQQTEELVRVKWKAGVIIRTKTCCPVNNKLLDMKNKVIAVRNGKRDSSTSDFLILKELFIYFYCIFPITIYSPYTLLPPAITTLLPMSMSPLSILLSPSAPYPQLSSYSPSLSLSLFSFLVQCLHQISHVSEEIICCLSLTGLFHLA